MQRFHPASGRHDVFTFEQRYVGSLALTTDSAVVLLGIDLGLYLFNLGSGELHLLCQVEVPSADNRLNDGRCDSAGRFWVGTMLGPFGYDAAVSFLAEHLRVRSAQI